MMSDELLIIPNGARVIIGDSIDGVVTSLTISGESMSIFYAVEWWDGRNLLSGSFFPSQLTVKDGSIKKVRFGFVTD